MALIQLSRLGGFWRFLRDDLFEPKIGISDAESARQFDTYANRLSALAEFNPHWVNASFDLSELVKGLQRSGSGQLCLYGPPGTGKSAFGEWLACQLEKPLMVKARDNGIE